MRANIKNGPTAKVKEVKQYTSIKTNILLIL